MKRRMFLLVALIWAVASTASAQSVVETRPLTKWDKRFDLISMDKITEWAETDPIEHAFVLVVEGGQKLVYETAKGKGDTKSVPLYQLSIELCVTDETSYLLIGHTHPPDGGKFSPPSKKDFMLLTSYITKPSKQKLTVQYAVASRGGWWMMSFEGENFAFDYEYKLKMSVESQALAKNRKLADMLITGYRGDVLAMNRDLEFRSDRSARKTRADLERFHFTAMREHNVLYETLSRYQRVLWRMMDAKWPDFLFAARDYFAFCKEEGVTVTFQIGPPKF